MWVLTHPSCDRRQGGVSTATLARPGNLTSGSELSQPRSEVLSPVGYVSSAC